MARAFVIVTLVAFVVATVKASRECYVCDSSNDFKSSKACKKDSFDTTKVPVIRAPDSKKECYLCSKFISSDDEVTRGCISKATYKAFKSTAGIKGDDDCKKANGDEYCVCPNNYCNGAGVLSVSLFSLIAAALLKLFF